MNKGIVVGITILFLGVAIQPSVATISLSETITTSSKNENLNNDLVEVTVQICREDGLENHTVMFTQQQADELDALIDNFKAKLDNAETIEETVKIYHNMVESLDEIGLLIEDASIKKTQEMIKNSHTNSNSIRFLEKIYRKNKIGKWLEDEYNTLCLISGKTTNSIFISPIACFISIIGFVFWIIYYILTIDPNLVLLTNLFKTLATLFHFILPTKLNGPVENRSIHFGSFIGIGGMWYKDPWGHPEHLPWFGKGWINTVGLNGIQNWSGTMRGMTYIKEFGRVWDTSQHYEYYPGVTGFVGYGYSVGKELFYIGTALTACVQTREN